MRLWDADSLEPIAAWSPAGPTFTTGVFSPDGRYVAGGGSSGTIHVYEVESGLEIGAYTTDVFVNSLTFALDGGVVAGAYGDGTLRLWDVETGTLSAQLQADPDIAFFAAASPDGSVLATAGQDTRIRLWNAASGELLRVIE